MFRQIKIIIHVALFFALTGCQLIYKQPITQGNLITAKQVAAIHQGMSVASVVNILGQPIMKNLYPEDRLVYVYSFKPGYGALETKHLMITFRNKRVFHVEHSLG